MAYKDLEIPGALKNVHTFEELKELYPEVEEVYSKISHTFYEVKKGYFIKVYYRTKNGDSLKYVTSFNTEDVNFEVFDVTMFYKEV